MSDTGYRVYAWTHLLRLLFLIPMAVLCWWGLLAPDVPLGFRALLLVIHGIYGIYAVVSHRRRADRRDYLAKYAIGRTGYGSLVVDETGGPRAAPGEPLTGLADRAQLKAHVDWKSEPPFVDWRRWDVLFKPGLPAGPNTVVGHFVYSGVWVRQDDTIQVQCDPDDTADVLIARLRWGVLQLLDAKSGRHGTEEDHRRNIRAMGIETP